MRRFNPGNFYCGTTAEWTSCPRPVRHPDHMSGSGSDYWYGESGVVRYSDHWGSEVASCDWYLDGVARCSFDDHDGWRCGFAPWTEFELKTFVYGQINVYGVTTKSERHKRSYWTRTADGNGIGGRKAPVPYGS